MRTRVLAALAALLFATSALADAPSSVVVTPQTGQSSAISPCLAGSSAGVCILKTTAANFYGAVMTAGATPLWMEVFNATTEPADGATTAGVAAGGLQDCVIVPANTSVAISYGSGPPEFFNTGIVVVASSTACATKTKSVTAFISGRGF